MVLMYNFSKDDGKIIHLAGADGDMDAPGVSCSLTTCSGAMLDKAVVRLDEFWNVVGTSLVKINNNQDKKHKYVTNFLFYILLNAQS